MRPVVALCATGAEVDVGTDTDADVGVGTGDDVNENDGPSSSDVALPGKNPITM